ncbi:MAG: phenylacetic acid degradation operon negative regulatory protein PaaX [Chloroflexota bacterium]|nr:MAG: phenylacetic acid degradation operon negative regulatory protein PaaX [Chloroflexota bacterium]
MQLGTQVHPHTFIFSLYGHYVLPRGGEIWIGSLIRALAALDFSAGAVRALVSRMQRKGFLQSRRVGRLSFYRLTDLGLQEVHRGGERAFAPPTAEWDGRWTVVTYSIPEKHRRRRDMLRRSLGSWGFGALAPGTWISPRPLSPEAESRLRDLDVWEYLEIFRAEHLGPSDQHTLVAHAWPQLSALGDRYRAYVARYEPVLRRFEAGTLDDEGCFTAHLRSLIDFVAITLEDPALPSALLPKDWPRPSAQSLFEELKRALAEPAERFFDAIYQTEGVTDGKRTQL